MKLRLNASARENGFMADDIGSMRPLQGAARRRFDGGRRRLIDDRRATLLL
jgi:hypothetical protein